MIVIDDKEYKYQLNERVMHIVNLNDIHSNKISTKNLKEYAKKYELLRKENDEYYTISGKKIDAGFDIIEFNQDGILRDPSVDWVNDKTHNSISIILKQNVEIHINRITSDIWNIIIGAKARSAQYINVIYTLEIQGEENVVNTIIKMVAGQIDCATLKLILKETHG